MDLWFNCITNESKWLEEQSMLIKLWFLTAQGLPVSRYSETGFSP